MRLSMITVFGIGLVVTLGCGGGRDDRSQRTGAGNGSRGTHDPSESDTPTSARVAIEEGALVVGSIPGTPQRSVGLEADRVRVIVPAFEIDGRPFPGRLPARTAVSRDEAAALCRQEGARLCHELEWERACAGNAQAPYPSGAHFDASACAAGRCVSSLGVASLGTERGEWTASDAPARGADGRILAIVRGSAAPDASGHRCAARRAVSPATIDPGIGFRCCRGPAPAVAYPTEPSLEVFERLQTTEEQLRAALAGVPELSRFAADFRLFRREEQADVLSRGANATPPVVVPEARIVRGVLKWTPVYGDTVWVFAGRSGTTTLVVALYPVGDGSFAHAASLVMPNDASVAVISTRDAESRTLGFSTCLGCGGEDGEVRVRDDGRFVVVTR